MGAWAGKEQTDAKAFRRALREGAHGSSLGGGVNRQVRGALAGVTATVPMSVVIAVGSLAGPLRNPPPEQIAATATGKVGLRDDLTGGLFSVAWLGAHLAYGGVGGALFAWLRPSLATGSGLAGPAWGVAVWAASYGLLMPVLGLYPRPSRQDPARAGWMLAAHLVYGAALEGAIRGFERVDGAG